MSHEFKYDVFLSHSAKDKPVVRDLAERLRKDGLKRESDNGKKPVKQIVFEGERFDVMSVRRLREKALGQGLG